MYNKEVKSIPEHYLDAKLWWRSPEWTEWVEHTAISQYFMPVPYRSASEPAWLAHDQDRLVVVGTLFTEKLTIYHYLCWSGIDTMFLTSPDADCALQPSFAWNAYKDWRSEPEAIIRALLVKNSRGEIVIMPEDRGRQPFPTAAQAIAIRRSAWRLSSLRGRTSSCIPLLIGLVEIIPAGPAPMDLADRTDTSMIRASSITLALYDSHDCYSTEHHGKYAQRHAFSRFLAS